MTRKFRIVTFSKIWRDVGHIKHCWGNLNEEETATHLHESKDLRGERIQTFLHDLKKQKGLLLENEDGNFVLSPKFQKKK